MPSGLILSEGKIPTYTSKQERVGNVTDRSKKSSPASNTEAPHKFRILH